MTTYKYKCQQCGLVVAMTRQQAQAANALMCSECAKAGIESPLLPSCRMECATNGTWWMRSPRILLKLMAWGAGGPHGRSC